jgi:glycosyltransferase involved in cell wall biosynthesis
MHIDSICNREAAGVTAGAWLSFERLCRGVTLAGHRIDVITWPEGVPPGSGGPAAAAARVRDSCTAFARTLERRWQANRPDVVHIELAGNVGSTALDAAVRAGLPVTSAFHHMHLYAPPAQQARMGRLLAGFHGRCHATVAQNPASAALLLAMGGPQAVAIPDGVDAQLFHPGRRDAAWRASVQAGPEDVVVLWAGRMVATKGLDLLAQAAAAVQAQLPTARVVCAGDGPEASRLRAALPWGRFCGVLDQQAMATALASADIFAFTSPDEPWGNVVLEAAASGLAIVARSGGAAVDVLLPNGACVDPMPQDAAGFTAALLRLAGDPGERQRLGLAARQAAEGASMAVCTQRWLALWQELASRPGTPT